MEVKLIFIFNSRNYTKTETRH